MEINNQQSDYLASKRQKIAQLQKKRQSIKRRRAGLFIASVLILLVSFLAVITLTQKINSALNPQSVDVNIQNFIQQTFEDKTNINNQTLSVQEVQALLQNPDLPNGCEATSLTMLINSFGVEVDKLQIAQLIPRADFDISDKGELFAPDPNYFFIGAPEIKGEGYYCYAGPVVAGANTFFNSSSIMLEAKDLSGSEFSAIEQKINDGTSVVIWTTIDFAPVKYSENSWFNALTYEKYTPVSNQHCVLFTKIDNGTCTVFDPISGKREVSVQTLKQSYEEIGKRAMFVEFVN